MLKTCQSALCLMSCEAIRASRHWRKSRSKSQLAGDQSKSVGPRSMILSYKYKFIFIKTAKTAGTSIEYFLSKHCGPQDIVTPIVPPLQGHQPRNYEGFINPIPEILQRPGKLFSALRHTMASCTKFYNHMPAREVKNRVPANVCSNYFKFCVE